MKTTWTALLLAGVIGQATNLPPFVQKYSKLVTSYYKAPNPELGPKMLHELLKEENLTHAWFQKNPHVLELIAAQLGDIGLKKPAIVRKYDEAFAVAPPAGRRIIVRALMTCGDAETLKELNVWIADPVNTNMRPELQALKGHLQDPKRKQVRDRPARVPLDLDLLWGNFFITGEYAPVSRILDVLDLPDTKQDAVLKRVARSSLASNLQQHPKLVEIVEKHAAMRPAASSKLIAELISALPPGSKK
jgi:hypothetical protein